MSPIEQIALAWSSLIRTVGRLRRPVFWVPALLLVTAELAAVAALWGFAHPVVSWAMAPLLERVAGEKALHYPHALHLLPRLQAGAETLILASIGAVLSGAATLLFAAPFHRQSPRPGAALAAALSRAVPLILAQLPVVLLGLVATGALQRVLRPGSAGGMRSMLFAFAGVGVAGLLRALFLYVPALIVLERRGTRDALAELPRAWGRGLWGAAFLAFVLMLPLLPAHLLAARGPGLEERFGPEAWVGVVAAHVVLGTLAWLLLWGSATVGYLGAVMDFDEWDPS